MNDTRSTPGTESRWANEYRRICKIDRLRQQADYPGVIPFARSNEKLFKGREDLSQEDRRVRGTLVTGLTRPDMRLLDYFEGNVSRSADTDHVDR
jgi:hypothetical protein